MPEDTESGTGHNVTALFAAWYTATEIILPDHMSHPTEGSHDQIGKHIDLPPELEEDLSQIAPDVPDTERWPGSPVHAIDETEAAPGSYEANVRDLTARATSRTIAENGPRHLELSPESKIAVGGLIQRYFRLERTAHESGAQADRTETLKAADSAYVDFMGAFNQYLEHRVDEEEFQVALSAFRAALDTAENNINPDLRQAA